MKENMQKPQGGYGMVKATMQVKGTAKETGKLEKGKDLRQNASGGSKAKGSL
jgi:hypothetical protein